MIADLVSLEAERELLGALLFHGREAWLRMQPLGLTPAALSPEHRGLFRVLAHLAERNAPPSTAMIADAALTLGETAIAEAPAHATAAIAEALGDLPGAAHHAGVIADLAHRRAVIAAAEALGRSAADRAVPVDELVRTQVAALVRPRRTLSTTDALSHALRDLDHAHTFAGLPMGPPLGVDRLDAAMDGLVPDRLIVLAARPGCGKTAFAIWAAHGLALNETPTLFVTLEMPARQLWQRRLCVALGADLRAEVRAGRWPRWKAQVEAAREALEQSPLVFDESARTVAEITLAVQRMRSEGRAPKVVIVDHLSWVESGASDRVSHHLAVGRITKGLARMAKEEGCAVMLLVQLNRESVKGGGKPRRPTLADLRDSGEIEQDADQVLMLWDPDHAEEGDRAPEIEVEMVLAKNRHGPMMAARVRWDRPTYRYFPAWRYGLEAAA